MTTTGKKTKAEPIADFINHLVLARQVAQDYDANRMSTIALLRRHGLQLFLLDRGLLWRTATVRTLITALVAVASNLSSRTSSDQ